MTTFIGSDQYQRAELGRMIRGNPARNTEEDAVPAAGAVGQRFVIAIGGATGSAAYTMQIRAGRFEAVATVTLPASTSQTDLRDRLIDALRADPLQGVIVASIVPGTNEIAVTMRATADDAVIDFPENPSTHLSVGAPSARTAAPVFRYGRACLVLAALSLFVSSITVGEIAAPTAQAFTFTITHSASQTYRASYRVTGAGVDRSGVLEWAAGGSAGATATAAKAAWDASPLAAFGVATVATNNVGIVMFPGVSYTETAPPTAGTGALVVTAVTAPGAPVEPALVVRDEHTTPSDSQLDGGPAPGPRVGSALRVVRREGPAEYSVEAPTSAPAAGALAWVETSGADAGRFFAAGSATRMPTGWRFGSIDPRNPAHVAITI